MHLANDDSTLEIRAVEITDSRIGDAPMLASLLSQVPEGEPIASVTADGAYDGRACGDAIALRGADAIILPRRNTKPWKKDSSGARGRNEDLRVMETFWTDALAQMVRLSSTKPGRDKDELPQATRSEAHSARL